MIYFYYIFLFSILCHISSGAPISVLAKVAKSEEGMRKKSREARHAAVHTQLAWREIYMYSMTGYNLAVNEAGEVYGARDFTTDCK